MIIILGRLLSVLPLNGLMWFELFFCYLLETCRNWSSNSDNALVSYGLGPVRLFVQVAIATTSESLLPGVVQMQTSTFQNNFLVCLLAWPVTGFSVPIPR